MSTSNEKLDNFANRLIRLRDRLGLTQEALGNRLGVSRNYIYLVEHGRRPGKKLIHKVREFEANSESHPPDFLAPSSVESERRSAVVAETPPEYAALSRDQMIAFLFDQAFRHETEAQHHRDVAHRLRETAEFLQRRLGKL